MKTLKIKNNLIINKSITLFSILVIVFGILTFIPPKTTAAQTNVVELFEQHNFMHNNIDMAYNLYLPNNYNANNNYRLVLFLHGAGDRGNNHVAPLNAGYGFIETLLNSDSYKNDTIILVPQCPEPYLWVENSWVTGEYTFSDTPSPAINLVKLLTDKIVNDYAVNKNKIYVSGVSMGGMAVWDLIARYPSYFAAAAPICGALDTTKIDSYIKTPIFTCNDIRDTIINAQPTVNVYNTLKSQNADIVYKNYDTSVRSDQSYHSSWIDAYSLDTSENNVYNFLFSKGLNTSNNNLDKDPVLIDLQKYINIIISLVVIGIAIIFIIKFIEHNKKELNKKDMD